MLGEHENQFSLTRAALRNGAAKKQIPISDAKCVERILLDDQVHHVYSAYVADLTFDGRPDLAVFGYTNTGIGLYGPNAAYIWISPPRSTEATQRC